MDQAYNATRTGGLTSDGAVERQPSKEDIARRAVITAHLSKVTTRAKDAAREELARVMRNGGREPVVDPRDDETEIGHVIRQKTTPTAAVADRAAFTAWMVEHHPEGVEQVTTIHDTNYGQALAVLAQHAPHLLTEETVVAGWSENEVLAATVRAKEPTGPEGEKDVPGVEFRKPKPGTVAVNLTQPDLIGELWREGRIALDGTVTTPPALTQRADSTGEDEPWLP